MKRLIITEEEKRDILLKHGSRLFINEAADPDVVAIQTKLGLTADGVAGPKTISAIIAKLGGGSSTAAATTQDTTVAAATTKDTTVAAAATTQDTTVAPTTPAAATTTTFSAAPVAGATTLEQACGTRKTNKDFRLCKKVFNKTAK